MTYSTNDDVQEHYPFAFAATSRPTTSQIAGFRGQSNGVINGYLRVSSDVTDTYSDILNIEVDLVNQFVDNYHARGRGERTYPVALSIDQMKILRKYRTTSGAFHVHKNVPG